MISEIEMEELKGMSNIIFLSMIISIAFTFIKVFNFQM